MLLFTRFSVQGDFFCTSSCCTWLVEKDESAVLNYNGGEK